MSACNDLSRRAASVPRGDPHRPHLRSAWGSSCVLSGKARLKLPHSPQCSVYLCVFVLVAAASKSYR